MRFGSSSCSIYAINHEPSLCRNAQCKCNKPGINLNKHRNLILRDGPLDPARAIGARIGDCRADTASEVTTIDLLPRVLVVWLVLESLLVSIAISHGNLVAAFGVGR